MKEIKAFIHRNRAADVIRSLRDNDFSKITVVDVKGILRALDPKDQEYSTELGARVMTEVKVELVCEEDNLNKAVRLIRDNAKTDQPNSGYIYVSPIELIVSI